MFVVDRTSPRVVETETLTSKPTLPPAPCDAAKLRARRRGFRYGIIGGIARPQSTDDGNDAADRLSRTANVISHCAEAKHDPVACVAISRLPEAISPDDSAAATISPFGLNTMSRTSWESPVRVARSMRSSARKIWDTRLRGQPKPAKTLGSRRSSYSPPYSTNSVIMRPDLHGHSPHCSTG